MVDEIVGRFELLTNVWGSPQSDFGRNQAWFEYASQLGELVGMEVVSLPVYSWGCAAGHAIRMAARLTGRREVRPRASVRPGAAVGHPQLLRASRRWAATSTWSTVGHDPTTGRLDLADLERQLSTRTAAVYVESPSYLGVIEAEGAEIGTARARGTARS